MRELKRTPRSSKLFLGVTFSLLLPLLIIACGKKPIPVWTGKIYAVDTRTQEFVRTQENERLPIEEQLDDWIAMTADDFELFFQVYVVGCESYPESSILVPIEKQLKKATP